MSDPEAKARLIDECNDKGCSYVDHTGDGQSGDVIFKDQSGDMRKAPYTLSNVGGKKAANIDHDSSKNVVPTVSYDEEADDADHMTNVGLNIANRDTLREMSDPVALAAIAMVGSVISAAIGLCNTYLINRNHNTTDAQHNATTATLQNTTATLDNVVKQTNGLVEKLSKAEFARGLKEGHEEK